MEKQKFDLSPDLVGKYKVIGTDSPLLESRIGLVDFRIMTVEKAEELLSAGTSYLVKLKKGNAAAEQ